MNERAEYGDNTHNGFLAGLIVGGAIGVGLAIAFAPRLASELRERIRGSVSNLKDAASEGYQTVTTRVAGVVDGATAKGQAVRDNMADAVGRGAREVERFAMASKTRA